jgi:hypothetical protein
MWDVLSWLSFSAGALVAVVFVVGLIEGSNCSRKRPSCSVRAQKVLPSTLQQTFHEAAKVGGAARLSGGAATCYSEQKSRLARATSSDEVYNLQFICNYLYECV